jgi:hypothetical protein
MTGNTILDTLRKAPFRGVTVTKRFREGLHSARNDSFSNVNRFKALTISFRDKTPDHFHILEILYRVIPGSLHNSGKML